MLQRRSNREACGGDNFEEGVKTDFMEKMTLGQRLEGGAMLVSAGRVLRQREE